jgi:hypothetical protein
VKATWKLAVLAGTVSVLGMGCSDAGAGASDAGGPPDCGCLPANCLSRCQAVAASCPQPATMCSQVCPAYGEAQLRCLETANCNLAVMSNCGSTQGTPDGGSTCVQNGQSGCSAVAGKYCCTLGFACEQSSTRCCQGSGTVNCLAGMCCSGLDCLDDLRGPSYGKVCRSP